MYEDFQALGAEIVGVSFDDPADNLAFHDANEFPYPLWSDLGRELALCYGAAADASQAYASRITVVLDDEGCLLKTYEKVNPMAHPQEVLDDLTELLE